MKNSFRKIGKQETTRKFQSEALAPTKTIAGNIIKSILETKDSGKIYIVDKEGKININSVMH